MINLPLLIPPEWTEHPYSNAALERRRKEIIINQSEVIDTYEEGIELLYCEKPINPMEKGQDRYICVGTNEPFVHVKFHADGKWHYLRVPPRMKDAHQALRWVWGIEE